MITVGSSAPRNADLWDGSIDSGITPRIPAPLLALCAGAGGALGRPTGTFVNVGTAGLNPGQQYRLVFLTDGTTDADGSTSSYNAFVTSQANTAQALVDMNTTWTAIASTTEVSAIDNISTIGTGVPIYSLSGQLVAIDYPTLLGGSLSSLINVSPSVATIGNLVWTGTLQSGTASSAPLGNNFSDATFGYSGYQTSGWVAAGPDAHFFEYRVYGMSDVLAAPAPEPSSALLLAGSGLLLALRRRRAASH